MLLGHVMVGGVTSWSITFCVTVDVLPLPSLNIQVTIVVPCAVIGKVTLGVPVTGPTQLSGATGAVGVAEHSAVMLGKLAGAAGGVTSSMMTCCLVTMKLPWPSSNTQ